MEPTPPEPPPKRSIPTWAIVVMTIVGVLVLAVGACFTLVLLRF